MFFITGGAVLLIALNKFIGATMKYLIFCAVLFTALSAQCEVRQVLEPLKPARLLRTAG